MIILLIYSHEIPNHSGFNWNLVHTTEIYGDIIGGIQVP